FDWNSISTNASPDLSTPRVCRFGSALNLFLKDRGVRRVSHRTGHIENSHFQPTMPILKTSGIGIFIVSKNRRRHSHVWPSLFDSSVDALNQSRDLSSLKVSELFAKHVDSCQWIRF